MVAVQPILERSQQLVALASKLVMELVLLELELELVLPVLLKYSIEFGFEASLVAQVSDWQR